MPLLCVQLRDMDVEDLALFALWCTCFLLNEYVLTIGMVFLIVHMSFQSKLHTSMNFPFLAWFHDMCAYGLIISTSGVLTPLTQFFPNILGSGRWRDLRRFWRRLRILNHPSWEVLTFRGQSHYQDYEVVLILILLCSFLFSWALNIV